MKRLLMVSIFFSLTLIVPMPAMAGEAIDAGISPPPPIAAEAPPEAGVMAAGGIVYVVAAADADTPQGGPAAGDEKQQDQSLEREKTTRSEHKSDWKINLWPEKPRDNIKSPHEMKDENKHIPPDRF